MKKLLLVISVVFLMGCEAEPERKVICELCQFDYVFEDSEWKCIPDTLFVSYDKKMCNGGYDAYYTFNNRHDIEEAIDEGLL